MAVQYPFRRAHRAAHSAAVDAGAIGDMLRCESLRHTWQIVSCLFVSRDLGGPQPDGSECQVILCKIYHGFMIDSYRGPLRTPVKRATFRAT